MFDFLSRRFYWIEKRYYKDDIKYAIMQRTPVGDITVEENDDLDYIESAINARLSSEED